MTSAAGMSSILQGPCSVVNMSTLSCCKVDNSQVAPPPPRFRSSVSLPCVSGFSQAKTTLTAPLQPALTPHLHTAPAGSTPPEVMLQQRPVSHPVCTCTMRKFKGQCSKGRAHHTHNTHAHRAMCVDPGHLG